MLSYNARRRLSLVILLLGLPLYIIVAVNVIAMFDRPSIVVEVFVYAFELDSSLSLSSGRHGEVVRGSTSVQP